MPGALNLIYANLNGLAESMFLAIGHFEPAHCSIGVLIWRAAVTFIVCVVVARGVPRRCLDGGRIVCGVSQLDIRAH